MCWVKKGNRFDEQVHFRKEKANSKIKFLYSVSPLLFPSLPPTLLPSLLSLCFFLLSSYVQKYYDQYEQLKAELKLKAPAGNHELPASSPVEPSPTIPVPSSPSLAKNKSELKKERRSSTDKERKADKVKSETRLKQPGMCLVDDCYNMAESVEERGGDYCSNECVVKHGK